MVVGYTIEEKGGKERGLGLVMLTGGSCRSLLERWLNSEHPTDLNQYLPPTCRCRNVSCIKGPSKAAPLRSQV